MAISVSCNNLLCLAVLCIVLLYNPIRCDGLSSNGKKFLFVFGDSLFDPGNNQYLQNATRNPSSYWPYGMNFHNHSTGRLSDGLLVPDFIAQYAKLEIVEPFLRPGAQFTSGASFASAGSGVFDSHPEVMNLKMQLRNFKKLVGEMETNVGNETTRNVLKRSVFLASMGGNDYFDYNTVYPNASISQLITCQRQVITNLTLGIKEVYRMGGRKFAFQNVGPLGCTPLIKYFHPELNGTCAQHFLLQAELHNKALRNALKKLSRKLPGFKYSVFDYYHSLGDRINHPKKYGFTEGERACCGSGSYNGKGCGGGEEGTASYKLCKDPNEYVFFDGGHTTQRTNQQLADLMWSGDQNVVAPYNVKQLFQVD